VTEIAVTPETTDFGGLEIAFDDRVLRPRQWTTAQSHWAAAELPQLPEGDVLELCSGAGHIGLLAVAGSDRRLVCVDVNPVAAAYTLRNAAAAGLGEQVTVREGLIADVLGPDERFPLIIADPPWVRQEETGRFPDDPLVAIDGGEDGLTVVRECVRAIVAHLAPGGVAVLQLGTAAQAAAVATALEDTGLRPGEVREYGDRGVLLRITRPA
jgi:release factor glutamine methyltransferase